MKPFAVRFGPPTSDEPPILHLLHVGLVTPEATARCDQFSTEHHYLKDARVVGEHLRYVVTAQCPWLALTTWGGAAWHREARDACIGWSGEQRRTRLPLLANNSRLVVLPPGSAPTSSAVS